MAYSLVLLAWSEATMFKDRDLAVIGAGAVLTILCLMLPFSFAGKVVAGIIVLGLAMVAALARFGPDRVNLEVWLLRVWRRRRSPTRFTFQRPGYKPPTSEGSAAPPEPEPSRNRHLRCRHPLRPHKLLRSRSASVWRATGSTTWPVYASWWSPCTSWPGSPRVGRQPLAGTFNTY